MTAAKKATNAIAGLWNPPLGNPAFWGQIEAEIEKETNNLQRDYDELKQFVRTITLDLQELARKTPEQKAEMFQQAYRLYVKHDVEGRGENALLAELEKNK